MQGKAVETFGVNINILPDYDHKEQKYVAK
jgi:hypothetical protein